MRSGELLMRKGQNAQELYQPVKSEYIIHKSSHHLIATSYTNNRFW